MAIRPVTNAAPSRSHDVASWAGLANGDTGAHVSNLGRHDTTGSIQFTGTFGVGGTVVLEESNDAVTWFTAKDDAGAAVSLTAAGLVGFKSKALHLRPRVTAGDVNTAIAAVIALQGEGA